MTHHQPIKARAERKQITCDTTGATARIAAKFCGHRPESEKGNYEHTPFV
jgi:hypothetical protein